MIYSNEDLPREPFLKRGNYEFLITTRNCICYTLFTDVVLYRMVIDKRRLGSADMFCFEFHEEYKLFRTCALFPPSRLLTLIRQIISISQLWRIQNVCQKQTGIKRERSTER